MASGPKRSLSLVPPSCMVAPVRELRNIFTSSFTNTSSTRNYRLPTVYQANDTGMDILKGRSPDNFDEVRGRTNSHNSSSSRDTSMSSTKSSVAYHERMEQNNGMDVDDPPKDSSPELSYETTQEKVTRLGMATENQMNMRPTQVNLAPNSCPQCGSGNHPNMTPPHGSTAQDKESAFINVPLPYDPNAPMDPEIWNGGFHPISLHGSIEHIASDAKSIKDSLKFMAKYISNKQVQLSKANDLDDLDGIGDVVWLFISSVYDSNWNVLFTDNKTNTLRKKIAYKFTPRVQVTPHKNSKEINKPSPASIERIPPLIPAKSLKEANIISKFFKNKDLDASTTAKTKFYVQVSRQNTSTTDVIKIKKTFPSIGAEKIDQINDIIKGVPKQKSCIQMTTKGPSCKQVIIFMGNENNINFIKNSFIHVTNLNRNLRNTKSEVLVDFIHSDPLGIMVVTNKVSLPSDLLIIENYVKNSESIDFTQVNSPYLPQSKFYLKIIGIPYFSHSNMQDRLTSNNIEHIIKQNHIFNNVTLVSKLRVIKVSPKLDMTIIWIDIWNAQSSARAKDLIN